MSEIADELERMAKKFNDEADVIATHAAPGSHASGHGFGKRAAASALLMRAAELRAQRIGPTYKPQPKPADVKAGQWWSVDDRPAMRVKLVFRSDGQNWATFGDGIDWHPSAATEAMMFNGRWRYHGDGERPEPAR